MDDDVGWGDAEEDVSEGNGEPRDDNEISWAQCTNFLGVVMVGSVVGVQALSSSQKFSDHVIASRLYDIYLIYLIAI